MNSCIIEHCNLSLSLNLMELIHMNTVHVIECRAVASMRQDEAIALSWFWPKIYFSEKNAMENA